MQNDLDRYEIYYADRLWNLLPEIYRIDDEEGALRELCERVGAQMAVVRRSIDRLWDDQSIETCDDWVVPYIGDLFGTNLVSGLDARGRRLDVANTIYYRRRKGTVTALEQLAGDVTGWNVRVVEFFRRLHRTRHGLDPEIGVAEAASDRIGARQFQLASGLVGRISGTAIGGTPHLRSVHGASKAGTAFDEFYYTPDVRRGEQRRGWYNIPRLGVFVWRLYSLPESTASTTSLLCDAVAAPSPCDTHFTFDPTGRQVPLFVTASRTTDRERFGATWVSPAEWELPGPIAKALLDEDRGSQSPKLYASAVGSALDPRSLGVFVANPVLELHPLDTTLRIWPEIGRFAFAKPLGPPQVWYHYGFSAHIGAGAYDRGPFAQQAETPNPPRSYNGGLGIIGQTPPPTSTITFNDSRTYRSIPPLDVHDLTIRSLNGRRPLIRPNAFTEWVLTGVAGSENTLRIEGLFISGADIVLRGDFDRVSISFSTFDPGEAPPLAKAIDGRELSPTTLWIEGTVRTLTVDRSITGPIRTRLGGTVGTVVIRDSILQSIATGSGGELTVQDLKDATVLLSALRQRSHPAAVALSGVLTRRTRNLLNLFRPGTSVSPSLVDAVVTDLNAGFSQPDLFGSIVAREGPVDVAQRNRRILTDAFPLAFADLALAFGSGEVRLERTTILGPIHVHRIDVSESILNDTATVDDPQQGCVRFSSWPGGSVLPRKYESVQIEPRASLFTSSSFANPAYAQLRSDVDSFIVPSPPNGEAAGDSIRSGAENGSEMGAFQSELASIKERSLEIKFEEFMPVGLVPVLIPVT